MNSTTALPPVVAPGPGTGVLRRAKGADIRFRPSRTFLGNRFVYAVISQRARGLSIGVNMNPDKFCDFDCAYCEVNRNVPARETTVQLDVLTRELEHLLGLAYQSRFHEFPEFANAPDELLALKEVALSGDGEPTLSVNFEEIVREVVHVRSKGKFPFFKIVLITNGSGLDRPEVRLGIRHLTSEDEIWAKLDAGTQRFMDKVNRSHDVKLPKVLRNILLLAKDRPVIIQSLFALIDGQEPSAAEIEKYIERLQEFVTEGANIAAVQVYSAHRAPNRPNCAHLPLKTLSSIAQQVRAKTNLPAEVF